MPWFTIFVKFPKRNPQTIHNIQNIVVNSAGQNLAFDGNADQKSVDDFCARLASDWCEVQLFKGKGLGRQVQEWKSTLLCGCIDRTLCTHGNGPIN